MSPPRNGLRPTGECVGVGFLATFSFALFLALIGIILRTLAGIDLSPYQPWTAVVVWSIAMFPGVAMARAWRRYDPRLRQLRRWLRVPEYGAATADGQVRP